MKSRHGRKTGTKLGSLLALAMMMGAAVPASADWLVLHDRTKLEILNGWEVKGPMVVFTRPDGTLSSLRASAVDFEASASVSAALARSATPAPTPSTPTREPVLVLTDRDVPQAVRELGAGPSHVPAAASSGSSNVVLESWAEIERPEIEGFEIRGVLANQGASPVEIYGIIVDLHDSDGALKRSRRASPIEAFLDPGSSTRFRVRFSGIAKDRVGVLFTVEAGDGSRRAGRVYHGPTRSDPESTGVRGESRRRPRRRHRD